MIVVMCFIKQVAKMNINCPFDCVTLRILALQLENFV